MTTNSTTPDTLDQLGTLIARYEAELIEYVTALLLDAARRCSDLADGADHDSD